MDIPKFQVPARTKGFEGASLREQEPATRCKTKPSKTSHSLQQGQNTLPKKHLATRRSLFFTWNIGILESINIYTYIFFIFSSFFEYSNIKKHRFQNSNFFVPVPTKLDIYSPPPRIRLFKILCVTTCLQHGLEV